ncbi:hypothetical protein [Pseudomonas viridiflava]|uniref:hypothetical protein n=1 Tax=Pseudomonas viridiflava TaxID=33069 RepID=UPI001C2CF8BC|nr:hypothetical protein [Pseudomonas viridiflava]MBV1809869.1 hypothetical protein [Pseudomonas viridiflava]
MKYKFEIALENSEVPDFFKGIGHYFSPDPDWGEHLHIRNWRDLCEYLKSYNDANEILANSFIKYLDSLRQSYTDAESLAYNISGYYSMRKDYPFMSEGGCDLIKTLASEKIIIGELFRLLRRDYLSHNIGRPVITLETLLDRIRHDGCTLDLEKL